MSFTSAWGFQALRCIPFRSCHSPYVIIFSAHSGTTVCISSLFVFHPSFRISLALLIHFRSHGSTMFREACACNIHGMDRIIKFVSLSCQGREIDTKFRGVGQGEHETSLDSITPFPSCEFWAPVSKRNTRSDGGVPSCSRPLRLRVHQEEQYRSRYHAHRGRTSYQRVLL